MSLNYLKEASDPRAREAAVATSSLTLSIPGEDHTLGNALRAMLNMNLKVDFAGYSLPHPTQQEMNFRLQTISDDIPALDVFEESLRSLAGLTQHVSDAFESAVQEYYEKTQRMSD